MPDKVAILGVFKHSLLIINRKLTATCEQSFLQWAIYTKLGIFLFCKPLQLKRSIWLLCKLIPSKWQTDLVDSSTDPVTIKYLLATWVGIQTWSFLCVPVRLFVCACEHFLLLKTTDLWQFTGRCFYNSSLRLHY